MSDQKFPEPLKHEFVFLLLVSPPVHRQSLPPSAGGPLQPHWRWFYFVWLCFSLQATEPSIEDLHLDKKESEVEVSLMERKQNLRSNTSERKIK